MNYSYILNNLSSKNQEVKEFLNDTYVYSWTIYLLKHDFLAWDSSEIDSFNRTKKWLIENYPELVL